MYFIGLRDGSPISVGRMGGFKASAELTANTGMLIDIDASGRLVAYDGTAAPFGVVSSSHDGGKAKKDEEVTVMQMNSDIYLDAVVSGTDEAIEALKDGAYIKATATGVVAGETSAFCRIVSTNGAKKAGDKVLVRFEYKA